MRKILLTLAALAAFGLALPVTTGSASAETVIIKKGHRDYGRHEGWRHRHREKIVVREKHRDRHHGVGVIVR